MEIFIRYIVIAAIISFFAAPLSGNDKNKTYFENGQFFVTSDSVKKVCVMSTTFVGGIDGDIYFGVLYDAKEKMVQLSFTSKRTSSLPDFGTRKLSLAFVENAGEQYDDGWGDREFQFKKHDSYHMFSSYFTGRKNIDQILEDIGRSRTIGISYQSDVLASLALDGSTAAIAQLKNCAFEIAGLNIRDPFAR